LIVAVVEKHEQFWRQHVGAIIVGGFALLLVVIGAGQLFEKGHVADWLADAPEQWAYVLCGLFVWFDAVIPIFPGETTLSAASTLAARGDLNLQLVMVAGALGAILGDSSLFWIARKSAAKMQTQRDKALENQKVRAVWDALDRSPGLLIVAGRYVPGMRFAVNASMGISDIPYRRFLP
jgi:membrane-associated protein